LPTRSTPGGARAQVRGMARELRDFDTLLAESEERRRLDAWRKERRQ
jgi:hypothetical protein